MKLTFDSPVVLIFSFVCAIVFLLSTLEIGNNWFVLINEWDTSNGAWYFRLFSHTVGHGSTQHLMSNMAILLLIGPIAEKRYGSMNLIIMILTTALLTGLIQILFFKEHLLGASGVVFMLILLVSMVNFQNKRIPLTFVLVVLLFIGQEIFGSLDGKEDGVSHSTHIVGGIVGAAFGFVLAGKKAKSNADSQEPII